ncbi:hypothetical protein D3C81_2088680 [compost metagenome]
MLAATVYGGGYGNALPVLMTGFVELVGGAKFALRSVSIKSTSLIAQCVRDDSQLPMSRAG